MKDWLLVCLLVCSFPSLSAAADVPQKIVAHISIIQSDEAEQRSAEATLDQVVSELETQFVPTAEATKVLRDSPCYASADVDACLANLAKQTGAAKALFIVGSVHTKQIVLTCRLVSTSGEVSKHPLSRAFPNAPPAQRSAALARALRTYFREELGMADLIPSLTDSAPDVIADPIADPPTNGATSTVSPTPAETGAKPLRLLSYALLGGGALAVTAAGGLALSAGAERQELSERLDETGSLRPGDDAALALHRRLRARGQLVTVVGIAGAAALATGGLLFVLSRDSGTPNIAAAVTPEGAALVVQGRF